MISDFDPKTSRDIVFIPVGINYDRVMEDRILTANLEREITGREFKTGIGSIFGLIGHLIKLRFQGKLYRLGYACVSFGNPISLKKYCEKQKLTLSGLKSEQKMPEITKFGEMLLTAVGRVIPALPVSLVATVFLNHPELKMGELQLKAKVFALIEKLEGDGVHVHIPRADRDYAVSTGLRMLTLRRLVKVDDEGYYRYDPNEKILMNYYANSIGHLLD